MEYIEIAKHYRKRIVEDIMPFWDQRCIDREYGGYFTCFDREGKLTDTDKYVWFQGRQLFVYANLYNDLEQRSEWLDMAEHGYHFLLDHAYAGSGRWHYFLNRKGDVKTGTISIFSDFHVLHGLAEYLKAIDCKDDVGMQVVLETYNAMEKSMFDPLFKDIYENQWSPVYIWHDMYLTCLASVDAFTDILGSEKTKRLVDECIDKILFWFAKDDYETVLEAVTRDNQPDLDTSTGRFVNPGHMLESIWFCLKVGYRRNDSDIIRRSLQVLRWANRIGEDQEYGGVIAYADALGGTPKPIDWFKETDSLWHEKVWWPNAEALASYAWAYSLDKDQSFFDMFIRQHEFCESYFYDEQFGEWYERLERNGQVKNSDKGTPWKCAFHLVRALINVENRFRCIGEYMLRDECV